MKTVNTDCVAVAVEMWWMFVSRTYNGLTSYNHGIGHDNLHFYTTHILQLVSVSLRFCLLF